MEFTPQVDKQFEAKINGSIEITLADFESEKVARDFINWCLTIVYTDEGVEIWWHAPRRQFGGQSAVDMWSESPQTVLDLAVRLVNL